MPPDTPALEWVADFAAFFGDEFEGALSYGALRKAESVGCAIGSSEWLADMAARTGLTLRSQKRGPKPKGAQSRRSEAPA